MPHGAQRSSPKKRGSICIAVVFVSVSTSYSHLL